MISIRKFGRHLMLAGAVLFLAACSNGGNLTLEPGAKKVVTNASPFVQVNLGGKALVVQQGKTASTGVHGWVSINAVSSKNLTGTGGTQMIMNKTQALAH